jgi:hypothetical protein
VRRFFSLSLVPSTQQLRRIHQECTPGRLQCLRAGPHHNCSVCEKPDESSERTTSEVARDDGAPETNAAPGLSWMESNSVRRGGRQPTAFSHTWFLTNCVPAISLCCIPRSEYHAGLPMSVWIQPTCHTIWQGIVCSFHTVAKLKPILAACVAGTSEQLRCFMDMWQEAVPKEARAPGCPAGDRHSGCKERCLQRLCYQCDASLAPGPLSG